MEKQKNKKQKAYRKRKQSFFPDTLFLRKGERWCRIVAQTVEKRGREEMADGNSTKSALAEAMKKLMVHKPFSKISISDLCEECGLNRKSFYYHFKDKYDLVNWIFYVDFLTNMSGKNFENEWDVLVSVCNIFYQNREFYQRALKIEGQNSFMEYFYEMLEPVVAFFVKDLFQVQNQELFETFFCDAFLTAVLRWFSMESELEPEKFVEELKEVLYSAAEKISSKSK